MKAVFSKKIKEVFKMIGGVSALSYNTVDFLRERLDLLLARGYLVCWRFIEHEPEEEEAKKHVHLYMLLAKKVEKDFLCEFFIEDNPKDLNRPLCCFSFVKCNYAEWFLYCLHDPIYLAKYGQKRKFIYSSDQFVSSCD